MDGLPPAIRDRIIVLEIKLSSLTNEVDDIKTDLKGAVREFHELIGDLRIGLMQQNNQSAIAVMRPMDRLTGIKLGLVGLGGLIIFAITVIGGVLGILAYFKPH